MSFLLLMIDITHLSSEQEKHSTESELHDDYSLDRTIDNTDRKDRKQEAASESSEEDIDYQASRVSEYYGSEYYESSIEGNFPFILSITMDFLNLKWLSIFFLILLYVLNLFEDEPKDCRIADCTKHLAEKLCPKTCFESKLCKVADCRKPESIKICPNTCAESTKEDIGKKRKTKVIESL